VASSNWAQESAAAARASAIQAGKDAQTAAAAARDAHKIAADKRKAEIAEAARKAAEEARKAEEAGQNPADSPDNDSVKGGLPWWKEDARWLANETNHVAIIAALVESGAGIAGGTIGLLGGTFGVGALETVALGAGFTSSTATALNVLFTGIGYGFDSGEFQTSLGSAMLSMITLGQSKAVEYFEKGSVYKLVPTVGRKLVNGGVGLVSPIIGLLSS
jgi:hypothetical protein